MGYCMTQRGAVFAFKPGVKEEQVLKAIKALDPAKNNGSGGSYYNGISTISFAWVNSGRVKGAETLADAFRAWRWELEEADGDNQYNIAFVGEKLGDDITLFGAIAPFVQPGSYVEMQGEDGSIWRWVFNGEEVEEKTAKVSFE